MKILAVCGHGLGSSFMVERNIKEVLKKLSIDADVSHVDLASVADNQADVFVVGRDLESGISSKVKSEKLVVLSSLISKKEIETKLTDYFNKK